MAIVHNNDIIHGMSGTFGEQIVYRQRFGKTLATKHPRKRPGKGTPAQEVMRSRFQQAVVYSKAVTADPVMKAAYQDAAPLGHSAFNVAVSDFFDAPDIEEIDVTQYNGLPGSTIKIKVTDDFKIKSVRVAVMDPDGSIWEQGEAVIDPDGQHWTYTASAHNQSLEGDKIIVTASDYPDNLTKAEKSTIRAISISRAFRTSFAPLSQA